MSFGDKRLDASYDRWITQTPEEYFGIEDEEEDDFTVIEEAKDVSNEEDTIFKCCICKKIEKGYGNNPDPIKKEGRCCERCNTIKVIPARLESLSTIKTVDEGGQ